jgi:hypothetical protein
MAKVPREPLLAADQGIFEATMQLTSRIDDKVGVCARCHDYANGTPTQQNTRALRHGLAFAVGPRSGGQAGSQGIIECLPSLAMASWRRDRTGRPR